MKLPAQIIILIFGMTLCNGQNIKANLHTNEHECYEFKGNVRSCETRHLNTKGEYHWSMMNNRNQDLFYNENRQLTKRTSYNIDGFLYADSIFADIEWTYTYNDGKIQSVVSNELNDGKKGSRWEYEHMNDSTTIKTSIEYSHDTLSVSKTIRVKDVLNNYRKSGSGEYALRSQKELVDEARVSRFMVFDKDENMIWYVIYNYTTDSLNNPKSIDYSVNLKKNDLTQTIKTYNEFGDVVRIIRIDEKDIVLKETILEYEYDEQNNWVKLHSNGHVTTREFKYY